MHSPALSKLYSKFGHYFFATGCFPPLNPLEKMWGMPEGEKQAEKDLSEPMMMVKEGSRKDGGHILPEIAQLFSPRNVCFATQSVIFFLH